ncbi:metallophosphoesterase [Rasiella sp. SM2506]|uniref:metallophosphoesterase n=1 Tax=Rasiella sp. SM2506 TaxID=3423914 RepID=UPI003D79C802
MKTLIINLSVSLLFVFVSYAQDTNTLPEKEVSHVFYATGNLGNQDSNQNNPVVNALATEMEKAGSNATVLFLGNNASNQGFSEKKSIGKSNLDSYINTLKPFSNNLYFIPGSSDWESGLKGLKDQEDYLESALKNKNVFQPEKGCPIEKVEINGDIDLLLIDSQWALMDWDKVPNINDHCDIKNKNDFYVEVEAEIVKSQGKTVLIATYHPIASYGQFGNPYAFGINPESINNKYYKEFSQRMLTIAQLSENVVFVSGHEKNMQYIIDKKIPIVISGAGGKISNAQGGSKSLFHGNEPGFSKLTAFKDGAMWVSFYGISNNFKTPLFVSEVIAPQVETTQPNYNENNTPAFVNKSIYEPEELERSGFYKALWGEHFREDYEQKIEVKSALLDTLYGGLTVMRKGGGHQTNSIRLEDKNGKQYAMRSAKKSALRFIQYFVFKTNYLEADVEDTYFIQLLQDYWTTANPYASLTVGDLSDALNIYHANTELYFIPKQKTLGKYNEDYGDKLYFIEERLSDGLGDVESLGSTDKIESTLDLLDELRHKDKIAINEALYIRTRLFDNIIGDWDRHADQWKWAVQEQENGVDLYEPIPRDRDQMFSDFDGFMLGVVTALSPPMRFMQRYDGTYNYTNWFNDAGDDVDLAILINHTQEDWLREAKFIKENLTEEVIDNAFKKFPKEIDQKKVARTKKALLERVAKVEENAVNLYEYLRSCVLITGTDKKDHFVITRKPDGITNVSGFRMKDGKMSTKFWDVDYDKKVTNELWVYGLDDDDIFEVVGKGDKYIKIKLIGGQNNDTYRVENKRNLRVFDQKSNPNTFETPVAKTLSDNYDLNTYYFKKNRRDLHNILPIIASNPDDGLKIGALFNYTKMSLRRNPFTAKHSLSAIYVTETSGIELEYTGEFANVLNDVNLGINAGYSSSSYTNNFFGFGNETINPEDELDLSLDFNRVRLQQLFFAPSLIYRSYQGSVLEFGLSYENIEAERTQGRFIETAAVNPMVFEGQDFFGAEVSYEYKNFDDETQPKSGIQFKVAAGYKANFDEDRGFPYVVPELRLTSKIDKKGILVYATKLKAHFNLSDEFEFYQAATIGDGDGLRGLRQQRFSGKRSYYQNSDLRLSLGRIRNSIIPISFGVYGGFDYGRVWVDDDNSSEWHTTPGGGLYFNIAGFTTANLGYFSSDEGGRLNILLSLAF